MNWKPIIIGALGALLIDLRNYAAARKSDNGASFDFVLAFTNFLMGGLVGAGITSSADALG